ncbi:MAG: polyprenyl synthetase family protein [Proteobacteria bacterium]|nr:polyprenyl synthetase family protein [Pseudomonadota bacterium]
MNFENYYQNKLEFFESYLSKNFPKIPEEATLLEEAMRYSLFAGGKRIRPILLLATLEAADKNCALGLPHACALEYIHTYSLIHDDLPCMDNDDLRRGQATNHVKYGEDIALLAGDALLTHSFALISDQNLVGPVPSDIMLTIIQLVSQKAGIYGMVSGQTADIIKYQQPTPIEAVNFIHRNKTGALITLSIQIGAILAGLDKTTLGHLIDFGDEIGKCFQIQDDILDETGSSESIGKTPGSDSKNEKLTYPSIVGLEKSYEYANESLKKALDSLKQTGLKDKRLEEIAKYIVHRER